MWLMKLNSIFAIKTENEIIEAVDVQTQKPL